MDRSLRAGVIGVMLGMITAPLDGMMLGPALPAIVKDPGGLGFFSWVATACLICVAASALTPEALLRLTPAAALAFAEHAAGEGLRLEYGKAIATGTFDTHRLIADAARQGKAELMAERLFRAQETVPVGGVAAKTTIRYTA